MRVERTVGENLRIGFPNASKRLEILEAIVVELATRAVVDKTTLETLISAMDQKDVDFPQNK